MSATMPAAATRSVLDSPTDFAQAAEAFMRLHAGPVTAHHVATTLSTLARAGYLVSASEHDRRVDEYAALLADVEQTTESLLKRLREGGQA